MQFARRSLSAVNARPRDRNGNSTWRYKRSGNNRATGGWCQALINRLGYRYDKASKMPNSRKKTRGFGIDYDCRETSRCGLTAYHY